MLKRNEVETWEDRTVFSLSNFDEWNGSGSRYVVIPSTPRRRDWLRVLLGRWIPGVTVYERSVEFDIDDRFFIFGSAEVVDRTTTFNLDHYERTVRDEVKAQYRKRWEEMGRPEPVTALEKHNVKVMKGN